MLYIYWFQDRDTSSNRYLVATNNPQRAVGTEAQGRFRLIGDPWAYNCSLRIRDAMRSDEGVYFFRVEREDMKYTYTHTTMTLRVAALTQEPDIHFPEPLKSGWPAELTCSLPGSCEGGRPLTFSWMGAALDSLDPETLHSSVVTFTPRPQDHGTNLTCQVKLPEVQATVERTIWLNVSYAPHNLTISIVSNVTALSILENTSSLLIWEGQALRLLCAAAGNPPAELSWFRGSPALNATPMYRTHILELPQVGAAEEGVLTCRAQNSLGSQHVSLRLSVVCPPRLLGPSCSWEGEALGCTCSARARPAPTLRWRLGEGLLEGNHSDASLTVTSSSEGPWANSSLSLRRPLGSDLRLSCEARNEHGAQSTDAVLVLLPGKSLSLAEAATAAVGGAGAMALLCLCLCLLLFWVVKARRKQASRSQEGMANEDPVMGTVDWSFRRCPLMATPALVWLWCSHTGFLVVSPTAWTLCAYSSSHQKCPSVPISVTPLHVSTSSALGKLCHFLPCQRPRLPPLRPQSSVSSPVSRGTSHNTTAFPHVWDVFAGGGCSCLSLRPCPPCPFCPFMKLGPCCPTWSYPECVVHDQSLERALFACTYSFCP
ncbi:sialic acid-binding Ig-like lectin 5 isoform X1 [Acinonyx jubatus]|uniref:Sialic acid-binding Ig-like lectin 5 isoform X1 n=1 Tax=Acinonyx jubatus TaxID=32536 RepID=A0ABM3P5F7_ACIJB|nr:sialic acid-binding Ig-like lectin 5 isoform X1 [Acinonyx jubatus]